MFTNCAAHHGAEQRAQRRQAGLLALDTITVGHQSEAMIQTRYIVPDEDDRSRENFGTY
jgi:hypothetical protein